MTDTIWQIQWYNYKMWQMERDKRIVKNSILQINMTNGMLQMQCSKFHMTNAIWLIQCDKHYVTNAMWKIRYEKCKVTNASENLGVEVLLSSGTVAW